LIIKEFAADANKAKKRALNHCGGNAWKSMIIF